MWQGFATLTAAVAGPGMNLIVQSTALLAVGLLAGRLLTRSGPAVLSGVYRTTLAAVLVCPIISPLLSVLGVEAPGLRINLRSTAPVLHLAVVPPKSLTAADEGTLSTDDPAAHFPPPHPATPAESATLTEPSSASQSTDRSVLAAGIAFGLTVWLLGSAVLSLQLLITHRRMVRLRASAVPAEAEARELCVELAEQMGVGSPAVLRSPFLFSPCLDGIRRPAILLPEETGDKLRDTFVHELAHLSRRDGLWNLVGRLVVALFCVHPLVWVLSRRLEATAEEVCDDYVVHFGGDRLCYAAHLLEFAGRALPPAPLAGVRMVALRSMLAGRDRSYPRLVAFALDRNQQTCRRSDCLHWRRRNGARGVAADWRSKPRGSRASRDDEGRTTWQDDPRTGRRSGWQARRDSDRHRRALAKTSTQGSAIPGNCPPSYEIMRMAVDKQGRFEMVV